MADVDSRGTPRGSSHAVEARQDASNASRQELSREQKVEIIQERLRPMVGMAQTNSMKSQPISSDLAVHHQHYTSSTDRQTIDPHKKAVEYYEKHQILDTFQQLTASLVLHRPEDPIEFLMKECSKMQKKSGLVAATPVIEVAFSTDSLETV